MCPFARLTKVPKCVWMSFFALFIMTVFLAEDATSLVTRLTQTRYSACNNCRRSSNVNVHGQQDVQAASSSSSQLMSTTTKISSPVAEIIYKEGTVTNLPWEESVNPKRRLTYMPLLVQQLEMMEKLGFTQVETNEKIALRTSQTKPAKIGNLLFTGGAFRKIRVTYFDAGEGVQVFNTLWYPKYEYDLPMLGIDLISLGMNRVLNVMDFQPLHPTDEYSAKYIDHLKPIRDKYTDLQGKLSGKIYDDTQFFSKQMLFGRFQNEKSIEKEVYPAFREYINAYVEMSQNAIPNSDPLAMQIVKKRQQEYDVYSALKDPAVGLFDAYFGKEWSYSFIHDFLFELSTQPKIDSEVYSSDVRPGKIPAVVKESKAKTTPEIITNTPTPVFQPISVTEREEVRAIPKGVGWILASAGFGAAFSAAQAILPPIESLNGP